PHRVQTHSPGGTVDQIEKSRACQAPPNQLPPRSETAVAPSGIGVQYERTVLLTSWPSLIGRGWAGCQEPPPSKLTSRPLPAATKRRWLSGRAGAANWTVLPSSALATRRSAGTIVNGTAGAIMTLSQCQVFGAQRVSHLVGE